MHKFKVKCKFKFNLHDKLMIVSMLTGWQND